VQAGRLLGRHVVLHGLLGRRLHLRVERGGDAQAAGVQLLLGDAPPDQFGARRRQHSFEERLGRLSDADGGGNGVDASERGARDLGRSFSQPSFGQGDVVGDEGMCV